MRVFSIVGYSSSGKTATAVALIGELRRRGYTVGAVKESHHAVKTDAKGTNTDRMSEAGASLVAVRGVNGTHVFAAGRLPAERLLALFDDDFVVMEGVREPAVPQIVTATDAAGIEARLTERTFAVSGVVSAALGEYAGLPVINALTHAGALADLIERHAQEWPRD